MIGIKDLWEEYTDIEAFTNGNMFRDDTATVKSRAELGEKGNTF